MTEHERMELAEQYQGMSEQNLIHLARKYDSLVEPAQDLLRAEFERRSLEAPLVDDSPGIAKSEKADMQLVTVGTYRDLPEAIVARSVLESADIPCFLCDENTIRMQWAWSNYIGGMRLQVLLTEEAAAREVLSQPMPLTIAVEGEPDFVQPSCPQCGSVQIESNDTDRKVKAASWLIGIPLPYFSNKNIWKCRHCGCKWEDDEEPQAGLAVSLPDALR